MAGPLRPFTQVPFDPALGQQTNDFLTWVLSALNQLQSQGSTPSGKGIQALSQNNIDPTTGQIASAGSRTSSVATAIIVVATTTSATFYWDGSNGSQVFKIGRDDGSVFGPSKAGSPFAVSSLSANTKYFFYPYFDEALSKIVFTSIPGEAVGSPAVAYTAPSFKAAQQQILRGRIPLGLILISTGLTTPNAGSTTTSGGSGGSASGSGVDRGALQG